MACRASSRPEHSAARMLRWRDTRVDHGEDRWVGLSLLGRSGLRHRVDDAGSQSLSLDLAAPVEPNDREKKRFLQQVSSADSFPQGGAYDLFDQVLRSPARPDSKRLDRMTDAGHRPSYRGRPLRTRWSSRTQMFGESHVGRAAAEALALVADRPGHCGLVQEHGEELPVLNERRAQELRRSLYRRGRPFEARSDEASNGPRRSRAGLSSSSASEAGPG